MQNPIDYSIIICTYNPDERLLRRCLHAVSNLDTGNLSTEVILVDNNSTVPVETLSVVREYAPKIASFTTIFVPQQGVKFARMAAIEKASGQYIIYFDYDNEPESDYLLQLKLLNAQNPQVAAIGPGNVTVDFIDGINKEIESYARIAFQERHDAVLKFSGLHEWQSCYPFGTGLCTHACLLKEYVQLARQNKFTMTGRKGNELTSGEDTQMVLYCISKGFFAGVSPSLHITHIIPKSRAEYNYLKRLAYGTGIAYQNSLLQVFPEHINKLKKELITSSKFSRRVLKKYITAKLNNNPGKMLELIQYIALNAGSYSALHKPLPLIVKKIIKWLKLP